MTSLPNQSSVDTIITAYKTTKNDPWSIFNDKLSSIPIVDYKKKYSNSLNPVVLSDKDIPVFGFFPRLENVTLTSCPYCRMVIKTDCFHFHFNQRHSNQENDNFSLNHFMLSDREDIITIAKNNINNSIHIHPTANETEDNFALTVNSTTTATTICDIFKPKSPSKCIEPRGNDICMKRPIFTPITTIIDNFNFDFNSEYDSNDGYLDVTIKNTVPSTSGDISTPINFEDSIDESLLINSDKDYSNVEELCTMETITQSLDFDNNEDEVDISSVSSTSGLQEHVYIKNAKSSSYANKTNTDGEVIEIDQKSTSNRRRTSKRQFNWPSYNIENKVKKIIIYTDDVNLHATSSSNHSAIDRNDTSFSRHDESPENLTFNNHRTDKPCLKFCDYTVCSNDIYDINNYVRLPNEIIIDGKRIRPYTFPKYNDPTDIIYGNGTDFEVLMHFCWNFLSKFKKRLHQDCTYYPIRWPSDMILIYL